MRKMLFRGVLLAAAGLLLCLLCACRPHTSSGLSTPDKETTSMTYDELTSRQLQWLEDAGLAAKDGQTLTATQKYLLSSAQAAFDYLEQRYPDQSFVLVGYSPISATQSRDKLTLIPQDGDPDLDRFAVYVDADGNCTDEYPAVYARAAFADMAQQPLTERYGEGNVKAYITLAAKSNLTFDGSADALELLRSGSLVADGTIIICARPGDEQSWLESYAADFASQGIPAQLTVEFATEAGFAGVDGSNCGMFYDSPEMLARYLCTSKADGSASAEKIS